MGLSSGTKLGPYEIQSALGAGGMGEVYRARDTRLDRTVAIKILPGHLSSNPELKARFEREARAVSSLNHPHICHLYDVGSQSGTDYLVMEYVDGETLGDHLHKGPLPLKQVLDLGIQITDALAAAHRAGILHRDLKPGNIMLTSSGAKLLDFGLAKTSPALPVSSAAASGLTPSTPTLTIAELSSPAKPLTRQGTVVGTFQYMAPEVLQGADADARSDIFALGCVLYEMATGQRAFEGKSQLSVLTGILEKDPDPVSRIAPASPAALDHVVKTCLEKNPEERFQTAQDVKLELKWIAGGGAAPAEAAPVVVTSSSRLGWIVAGVALLAALALAGAYFRATSRPETVVRSSIVPPPGTSFVTMVPSSGPAVISPDGSRLAFIARDEKGRILLYLRSLTGLSAQPLLGTDDAMYPFWSPDGREIGFFAQGKVKKVSAAAGPVQIVCDAINGRGGAWNKDGVIVFAPSATSSLLRVPAAGGTPEPASRVESARGDNSHRWPRFLPDSQHFLFWARNAGGIQDQSLFLGTLGSLQAKVILKGVTTATYASGYLLFMRDQTLLAQPFDTSRLELTGEAASIAERVATNAATAVPEFSASETGILIYQMGGASGAWDLLWFARDGKPGGAVAQMERYYYPTLSPDDSRLAVSLFNGLQGTADIWIFDLKRGTKSRLTFGPGTQTSAVWSLDGKTVYYASNRGTNHIYAKSADGSGSERAILESPDASEMPYSISPDGRYLVHTRRLLNDPRNNLDIWALPLSGNDKPFPIVQTAFDDVGPAVSPKGQWMAYQNNESGRMEIYLTPFPGGGARWQVSTSGGVDAQWRRDGKELFFLDPADNLMAVDVDTSSGAPRLGAPHVLFQALGIQRQVGSFVATADGKRFLINSANEKNGGEPLTLVINWQADLKK